MPLYRDTAGLGTATTDLLVIGGGIYGICSAWEAARRGLSVVVIERGDFGAATSSNSLHTMHGGLRYLQHLDLRRMRESIRERRFWLQGAPDLVRPMPFVLPTVGHGGRGPEALQAALMLNDIISADRNRGVPLAGHLPRGQRLSRAQAHGQFGTLQIPGYNGAALWYDGFSRSPERVLIALLQAAAATGARFVNYCAAAELLRENGRIVGAVAHDLVSGEHIQLRARCVLNATGPWVDALAQMAGRRSPVPLFSPSKALNLVVPRLPLEAAIGVPAPRHAKQNDGSSNKVAATYFIIPWGERSLIGTKHLHFQGSADTLRVESRDVIDFLAEINTVLGPHQLRASDILAVKCGLLPEQDGVRVTDDVKLQRHARIVDHEREDGIAGLVSIVGVKWTTARLVAQQAVGGICGKLLRADAAGLEPRTQFTSPLSAKMKGADDTPLVDDCTASEQAFSQAAGNEMAVHLADAVLRRTDLWLSRSLTPEVLWRAAAAMAAVHGWSATQIQTEVDATQSALECRQSWRTIAAA